MVLGRSVLSQSKGRVLKNFSGGLRTQIPFIYTLLMYLLWLLRTCDLNSLILMPSYSHFIPLVTPLCEFMMKLQHQLDIRRGDIKIKQYTSEIYLSCILDENLSGESMATRALGKINGRLRFLYRKQNFLDFLFVGY